MSQSFTPLRNTVIVLIIAIAFNCSSCYSVRIATAAQAGTDAPKPKTVHSLLWGLAQSPKEIHLPNCDSLQLNGMAEVQIKTNIGYALITVLTLGIWSPMKYTWKCSKPCKKSGSI